jgi:hypothetical protein
MLIDDFPMSSTAINSSRWASFAERDGKFHFVIPTSRTSAPTLLCGYRPDREAVRRRRDLPTHDRRLSGQQCRNCIDVRAAMDSGGSLRGRLAGRLIQPGDDRSFKQSERNFITAVGQLLPSNYEVIEKPRDLSDIFGPYGVVPEAKIISRDTGRFVFVEVKKQGARGNAEERAYKHYAPGFIRLLHERYGFDYHPFVTVFCESLAVDRRYTEKIRQMIDYPHYCLWANYRRDLLARWLDDLTRVWLD